jgi:hypothetical protein
VSENSKRCARNSECQSACGEPDRERVFSTLEHLIACIVTLAHPRNHHSQVAHAKAASVAKLKRQLAAHETTLDVLAEERTTLLRSCPASLVTRGGDADAAQASGGEPALHATIFPLVALPLYVLLRVPAAASRLGRGIRLLRTARIVCGRRHSILRRVAEASASWGGCLAAMSLLSRGAVVFSFCRGRRRRGCDGRGR